MEKKRIRKKKTNIPLIVIGVLGIAMLIFIGICYNGIQTVSINNKDYNISTLSEALKDDVEQSIFNDENMDQYVTSTVDISNIENRSLIERISDYFHKTDYTVDYTYEIDTDGLTEYLESYNGSAIQTEDAYITVSDNKFVIVDEIYGTNVDIEEIINNTDSYSGTLINYYVQPEVTASDLGNVVDRMNTYASWTCVYTNGFTISSSTDYVSYEDGEIIVDSSWIHDAIYGNLSDYNTVGEEGAFHTSNGEDIIVPGGTWGSSVDYDSEIESVTTAFNLGTSLTDKEPEYSYYRDDIGNTYVEVSIDDQHVWVYQDGKLLMDSDCVTGDAHLNRDTPTGIYYISEMVNGKYLRGDDYTTWVNKWMRLTNSGVGLHDAYWRSSFGGNIYKTNGSHGCINLPKSFAYDLYDVAYVGMPVIIY